MSVVAPPCLDFASVENLGNTQKVMCVQRVRHGSESLKIKTRLKRQRAWPGRDSDQESDFMVPAGQHWLMNDFASGE